jgi:hypothetical protein
LAEIAQYWEAAAGCQNREEEGEVKGLILGEAEVSGLKALTAYRASLGCETD